MRESAQLCVIFNKQYATQIDRSKAVCSNLFCFDCGWSAGNSTLQDLTMDKQGCFKIRHHRLRQLRSLIIGYIPKRLTRLAASLNITCLGIDAILFCKRVTPIPLRRIYTNLTNMVKSTIGARITSNFCDMICNLLPASVSRASD